MSAASLLSDHLWSGPRHTPEQAEAFVGQAHARSVTVVRLFYVVGVVWMAQSMSNWMGLLDNQTITPLWPAGWLDRVDHRTGVTAVLVAYALSTIVVAAMPRWRLARIASALSLLQYMAVINGVGKVGHGLHGWLWVSAFLILLPAGKRSWRAVPPPGQRRAFLHVIVLSQMALLFFYSLTGFWKMFYGVRDLFGPGVSAFQIDGFAYIIGGTLLDTGRETLLGDLLVESPILGWALFNGTMYLELTSLVILFRPRLHRMWGIGLILFHLGTQAAMGINFPANIALVGLLLVASPVAPDDADLKSTVLDLPLVHLAWRIARRRHRGKKAPAPSRPPVAAPAPLDASS